ncbi:AAA family ATPase [Rhizobium daejeonense]|uniref:AAA family ATPase n=1 Tax=Rhizobium daejeonense TaxID=240521 RepID=A0A6M1RRX3_9HYPH|nr:AAA family ATPase [Rhizobium daejeonense]NGO64424.1 AAA family ATPase [Rhizobium daejeonense]
MNHVLNEGEYRLENIAVRHDDLVMISGCSGGGKSTLLEELSRRGFATFEEPGRQVVREQLFIDGEALPWTNLPLFVELTISRSINFMTEAARREGRTFFDRGIIDQIAGLEQAGHAVPPVYLRAAERLRYRRQVFLLPPWPEIYRNDAERRHGLEPAIEAFRYLENAYRRFGYELVEVPRNGVGERADFILSTLAPQEPG